MMQGMIRFFLPLVLVTTSLSALLIGNPAQPYLYQEGVLRDRAKSFSFRMGYFGDQLYRASFKDEFKLDSLPSNPSFVRMVTDGALLTFNFRRKLDLYGIVASSEIQVDREIYAKRAFGWGLGLTWEMLRLQNFHLSTQIKYYETDQKPSFFLSNGSAYSVLGNFKLKYNETFVALGAAYQIKWLIPYINATYLHAKINPIPSVLLVKMPDTGEPIDVTSKSVMTDQPWGIALGATLLSLGKMTLNAESRLFNQNGLDLSAELRF